MEKSTYSTLVIDSSELAQYAGSPYRVPTVFAKTGEEGKAALLDSNRKFAAIFINPVLTKPGFLQTIALAHKHRPGVPLFVLYDQKDPLSVQEMTRLAIAKAIKKPLTDEIIQKNISEEVFNYHPNQEGIEATQTEDAEFVPIATADLLGGVPSFFDIYVRLPSGRHVKILDARDTLSPQRTLTYLEKGVPHFYLKKEAQKRCLTYCTILSHSLISNPDISYEIKYSESLNQGEALIDTIRKQGLQEESFDSIFEFLSNIHILTRKLNVSQEQAVQAFLANAHAYDHAVSTTIVAALLTSPLKIESTRAFETVGIASFLHDIALYQLLPHLQTHDESKMTEEEKNQYRNHPIASAEMVSQFQNVDTTTRQAIAQHHERRNNKGFPGKIPPSEINRVAEIVGLSDEFVRILENSKRVPGMNSLQEMERNIFDGFSFPVIEAFRSIFMKP